MKEQNKSHEMFTQYFELARQANIGAIEIKDFDKKVLDLLLSHQMITRDEFEEAEGDAIRVGGLMKKHRCNRQDFI